MKELIIFAIFLILPLVGCVTSPGEIVRTNINPLPVHLGKLGYYLMILDVTLPKESANSSIPEQRFSSNYMADELSKYIDSPEYQKSFLKWKKAPSSEKAPLWKELRDQVDSFVAQKIRKLNQVNQQIHIDRALLGFHLSPPPKKEKEKEKGKKSGKGSDK